MTHNIQRLNLEGMVAAALAPQTVGEESTPNYNELLDAEWSSSCSTIEDEGEDSGDDSDG